MVRVNDLVKIVGAGHVRNEPEFLASLAGDRSFTRGFAPDAVVSPGDRDEVQELVQWARAIQTPLVPMSSGGPHYHGAAVPSVPGAVIVDMQRLNRILRVDRRNRVALVEAGVTFGDLVPALAREGLAAYLPVAPRAKKSVVAGMLEREPVTWPNHHWDATDPMLCVEVVWGSGDRMRTGEATSPDPLELQWEQGKAQLNPFGLGQMNENRLLSGAQGTIGIVTWSSLKCRFAHSAGQALIVPADDPGSLVALSYKVLRRRLGDRHFIVNRPNLAALLDIRGPAARDLPPWALFFSAEGYGILPEKKVAYQIADMEDLVAGFNLKVVREVGQTGSDEILETVGKPCSGTYWKERPTGSFQEVFFQTTLDQVPTHLNRFGEISASRGQPLTEVGVYIQPMVQGTSCHCEFNLFYDQTSEEETSGVRYLTDEACRRLSDGGAFFYRPYGAWKDFAWGEGDDNIRMQREIKKIFDPAGILNPGRLCH